MAALLWFALFWVIYGLAGRADSSSLLRRIAHYISFAYGVGFVLFGLFQLIQLAILSISGMSITPTDFLNSYNFVLPLLLGLLIAGVYILWLRSAARRDPAQWQISLLIGEVIIAVFMAAVFYTGAALALLNLTELPVDIHTWAISLSLLITGVGYLALDVFLHYQNRAGVPGALAARRGFVFTLLGGGILAGAVGGAFALYSLISAALGSSIANGQNITRAGASAFVVGAVIVVIYLLITLREKLFSGLVNRAAVTSSASSAPTAPPTIESVLDELLAGKISREAAAARIKAISPVKEDKSGGV